MKRKLSYLLIGLILAQIGFGDEVETGWFSLFDGETLAGWQSNEEVPHAFRVENGAIKVSGGRTHLFYKGDVNGGSFKDFEFKAKVRTTVGSNSGIFFHTKFQEKGWPSKGYECQVNTTHSDRRKTGSLYGVQDVLNKAPSKDGQWFDYYIKVQGKQVVIKIDGVKVVDYTEPDDLVRPATFAGRRLGEGTFAIQGHDPKSVTYFKDIYVRPIN